MAKPDWTQYAVHRNLSRNRLLLARHAEVVEDFLKTFGQIPNDRKVLDVGPANGLFMVLLRELGYERVHGLEISPEFLKRLRAKNLAAFLGDIVEGAGLDALDPPYDVVLLMEILEHLESPEQALRKARELLATNGTLYATVPARDCVFDKIRRLTGSKSRRAQVEEIDETHLHAFDVAGLRALFDSAGFRIDGLRRVSTQPPFASHYAPGHRGFALLRAVLPRWWRGFFLAVEARKA